MRKITNGRATRGQSTGKGQADSSKLDAGVSNALVNNTCLCVCVCVCVRGGGGGGGA